MASPLRRCAPLTEICFSHGMTVAGRGVPKMALLAPFRLWLLLIALAWAASAHSNAWSDDAQQRPLIPQVEVVQQPLGSDPTRSSPVTSPGPLAPAAAQSCESPQGCWLRVSSADGDIGSPSVLQIRPVRPGTRVLFTSGDDSAPRLRREADHYPQNWKSVSPGLAIPIAASLPTYIWLQGKLDQQSFKLWSADAFAKHQLSHALYVCVALGATVALLLASLAYWMWLPDRIYRYFSFTLLSLVALHCVNLGSVVAEPGSAGWASDDLAGATRCFYSLAATLFTAHFFDFRAHALAVHRVFLAAAFINGAAALVSLAGYAVRIEPAISQLSALTTVLGMLTAGWIVLVRKQRQYLAAGMLLMLPALIGLAIRVMDRSGLLLQPGDSANAAWLAVRLTFLVVMTALVASRAHRSEQALYETRRLALAQAIRSERELEGKVAQRTSELANANAQLTGEIEARTRAEAQARQALDTERVLMAQQREFVSLVSHEFRTPLAVINAAADAIDLSGNRSQRQQSTRRIRHHVGRLVALMENVLASERLDSSKGLSQNSRVPAQAFVQHTLSQLESEGSGRLRFLGDAPEVCVKADARLLDVALHNVIRNALRYSEGEVIVQIKLEAQTVHIDIQDHGPGIEPEYIPRLFSRFQRGRQTRGKSGSGLGLHLSREILRRHGGDLSLYANGQDGATFRLSLPVSD